MFKFLQLEKVGHNKSFVCPECHGEMRREYLKENVYPRLASMGSPVGGLLCEYCRSFISLMSGVGPGGGLSFDHIQIVAAPGLEYETLQRSILITRADESAGWYLRTKGAWDLFDQLGFSIYAFNWLTSGLPALFNDLANAEKHDITFSLECWEHAGYQVILEYLTEQRYEKTAQWGSRPEGISSPAFKRLAQEAYDYAYDAYHGQTLDLHWLKRHLPEIVRLLQEVCAFMPARTTTHNRAGDIQFGDIYRSDTGLIQVAVFPLRGDWIRFPNYPEVNDHFRIGIIGHIDGQKIGSRADLPGEVDAVIRPYAEGVMIGGMYFNDGVNFMDEADRENFENHDWNLLPGGSESNANLFFSKDISNRDFRILVHVGDCWSTWKCFGPFQDTDVESELEKMRTKFPPQKALSSGVYESRGDRRNKIEIYRGLKLIYEEKSLRGAYAP